MLGTEQLQHGRIHFATAAEAFFRQPIRTKIHYHLRQSAEWLQIFNMQMWLIKEKMELSKHYFKCLIHSI